MVKPVSEEMIIQLIELYYLRSFRTNPEQLGEIFLKIANEVSQLKAGSQQEQTIITEWLSQLLGALERKDFVLIRDILWYEVKPFCENRLQK